MASFLPVQALVKGITLLRLISSARSISMAELTRASKLPHATAVRLVETLMAEGYVLRDPGTGRLTVSGKTLLLSNGFDGSKRLGEVAASLLADFHKRFGWPLNLALFDRDAMIIAHTSRRRNAFALDIAAGSRSPLLVTGIGRVYLAFRPKAEVTAVLERLRGSPNRWDNDARDSEKVFTRLEAVRQKGFALAARAYVRDVYDDAIWAVAVPVLVNDKAVAALSALVLRQDDLVVDRQAQDLSRELAKLAEKIADLMVVHLAVDT